MQPFFHLGLLGEWNAIDTLETVLCGVSLPVTGGVLKDFECFGLAGVLDVRSRAQIHEITNFVNWCLVHNFGVYEFLFVLILSKQVESLLFWAV